MSNTFDPDRCYALIQRAISLIGEHDVRAACDTPEIAEALGLLSEARTMVRPFSLTKKPGMQECPGVYMQTHTRIAPGVARCNHCGRELRTTSYGRNLREHYVAPLTPAHP